jgi:hypothetical protein
MAFMRTRSSGRPTATAASSLRRAASCVVRRSDVHRGHARLGDLPGIPLLGLAVALQHAEQVPHALDVAEEVAGVGVPGDEAQRLALAAAPDHDRDVAAQRAGVVQDAVRAVMAALHRRLRFGEHRAGDAQRVLQALEALLQRREAKP